MQQVKRHLVELEFKMSDWINQLQIETQHQHIFENNHYKKR